MIDLFHATSDLLIAFAYFSIPIQLSIFTRKIDISQESRAFHFVVKIFESFIFGCGLTHLFNFLFWLWPNYLTMMVLVISKISTAIISLFTVYQLLYLIPTILSFYTQAKHNHTLVNHTLQQTELAKIEAESANQVKDNCINTLSHEYRNSLFVINANSEFLLENESDLEKIDQIQTIIDQCKTMAGIANDVLSIAKIDAGKLVINKEICNLSDLCRKLIDNIKIFAKSTNNTIELDYLCHYNVVICDEIKISQILINLLQNAVKFTNNGTIILRVRQTFKQIDVEEMMTKQQTPKSILRTIAKQNSTNEDSPKAVFMPARTIHSSECSPNQHVTGWFTFEIVDSGQGLSQNSLNQLFTPFSQIKAMKHNPNMIGSGLGLHLVHKLTDAMKGQIFVTSHLNKGTHFTVILKLPCIVDSVQYTKDYISRGFDKNHTNYQCLKEKHILIVDDQHINRKIIEKMLKNICNTTLAASGLEALNLLQSANSSFMNRKKIDLVLMDISMPELNGNDATKLIRNFSNVPIVGLSGNCLQSDVDKAIFAGMNDFLSKPISSQSLLQILMKFCCSVQDQSQDTPQNLNNSETSTPSSADIYVNDNSSLLRHERQHLQQFD